MPVYDEFRPSAWLWKAKHLSDKVPWRMLATPGVILQKRGHALQRTYWMRGPDLMGETPETQGSIMLAANNALKRLGGSWVLHSEVRRLRSQARLPGVGFHPVSQWLDTRWQDHLQAPPGLRESHYYWTLTWRPPVPVGQAWRQARGRVGADEQEAQAEAHLAEFVAQTDHWMSLLKGILAVGRPLTTDELLTYLHSVVSDRWHPVGCPLFPIDLDVRLCDREYGLCEEGEPGTGGFRLGEWHLRLCSLMGYPATSITGALRQIESLDLDFRFVTRWIAMEKHLQSNLLRRTQGAWIGNERSFFARVAESVSQQPTRILNNDATIKAEGVDAARQELGSDIVGYGNFTGTVVTWDVDPDVADRKRREVMQVFEAQGFTVTPEQRHATAAWLSTHPGNRQDSVRRTPQHTLTLAHFAPGLSVAWPGPDRDEHLAAPAWFLAETDGHSRFQVVNHVLQNGHQKILGPTRSGKSVFLGFEVSQWLERYVGAQAFPFDVDLSMRCLTLCLGGLHADLGKGELRIQPLRRLEAREDRAWAGEWVRLLLTEQGVSATAGLNSIIDGALDRLGKMPPAQRTLEAFYDDVTATNNHLERHPGRPTGDGSYSKSQRHENLLGLTSEILAALAPFIKGGRFGHLMDHSHDDLVGSTERLITFEQSTLLGLPQALKPMMRAVFHRLEARFETRTPTFLPMDEFAILAAIPEFATQGKEWLMTRAKKNVSLAFATHSIAQIFGSADNVLGALMLEGCASTFVLPNAQARTPQMAEIYQRLGFNAADIRLIATAQPQRDVYYASELLGKRLFHLRLPPPLLSVLARNRAEDHEKMDTILAQEGREGFGAAWLRAEGYETETLGLGVMHAAD